MPLMNKLNCGFKNMIYLHIKKLYIKDITLFIKKKKSYVLLKHFHRRVLAQTITKEKIPLLPKTAMTD